MLISVIVPCYDEEAVISETHARLSAVLGQLDGHDYEILYVDDGSRDQTPHILHQLQSGDGHVRVLRLSRNFGHQIALTAGLEHAAGAAVIVIDADLQDPPEVIPEMIARWQDGYEVVYGVRTDRPGESSFKLWTAKTFYKLINRLSETKMPLDAGDFRLLDRVVVDALLAMPERDRFVRGMVSWVGFRQVAILYARAATRGRRQIPAAQDDKICSGWSALVFADAVAVRRLDRLAGDYHVTGRNHLRGVAAPVHDRLGARVGLDLRRCSLSGRRATRLARHHRRVHRTDLRRGEAPTALLIARATRIRAATGHGAGNCYQPQ